MLSSLVEYLFISVCSFSVGFFFSLYMCYFGLSISLGLFFYFLAADYAWESICIVVYSHVFIQYLFKVDLECCRCYLQHSDCD